MLRRNFNSTAFPWLVQSGILDWVAQQYKFDNFSWVAVAWKVSFDTPAWYRSVCHVRSGIAAQEFSFGNFRLSFSFWKLSLSNFLSESTVYEHSPGICRVTASVWGVSFENNSTDPSFRFYSHINSRLEHPVRKNMSDFRLGSFTQEKLAGLGELGT